MTQLQLANLGVRNEDYDIIYLDGPIEEEEGDPEITEFVSGPSFNSWYHSSYSDARFKSSFFQAIVTVLVAIRELGPFDAVYGFSQGAVVAAISALIWNDHELKDAIVSYSNESESSGTRHSLRSSLLGSDLNRLYKNTFSLRFERKMANSFQSSFRKSLRTAIGMLAHSLQEGTNNPFDYMILACPIADPHTIRHALGLREGMDEFSISIPSMLLIGIEDHQKMKSEKFGYMFSDLQVKYMVGGHAVPRMVSADKELVRTLRRNLKEKRNAVEIQAPNMRKVYDITSIGLLSSIQFAHG